METSESITELIKALAKAQSEFEPVKKTKVNTYHKSKYATLDDVLAMCLPVLHKHNLVVIQPVTTVNDVTTLETRLYHTNGEWLSIAAVIPGFEQKGASVMQTVGIGITYMRRYMLSSLLGISTEDDDGNKPEQPKATKEQKEQIIKAIKDLGLTDVDKALKDAHFPILSKLTEQQAQSAITRLEKAVKAKKDKDEA